jgi:hypothetical protein
MRKYRVVILSDNYRFSLPLLRRASGQLSEWGLFNPLTPELNPPAQRCLPRFFTGDFDF